MGVSTEFENLEQQFLELIGEFRTLSTSESRLREAVRTEATRAEAAEAACASAQRAAAEAQNGAAAATAGVTQASGELSSTLEQITGLKIQLEIANCQKKIFEEKCIEMSSQISALEKEVQQLRPLQTTQAALHRQYTELHERIHSITEETRKEASRLESELRRVERCAAGGTEIRERARLAAAAHARERRLAAAELQHTARELNAANAVTRRQSAQNAGSIPTLNGNANSLTYARVEISRLSLLVAELQHRVTHENSSKSQTLVDPDKESLAEQREALQAERAGTEKLEKALSAAVADNAALAAQIRAKEMTLSQVQAPTPPSSMSNICPIDSFLAE